VPPPQDVASDSAAADGATVPIGAEEAAAAYAAAPRGTADTNIASTSAQPSLVETAPPVSGTGAGVGQAERMEWPPAHGATMHQVMPPPLHCQPASAPIYSSTLERGPVLD
jgi:hypothetical protein